MPLVSSGGKKIFFHFLISLFIEFSPTPSDGSEIEKPFSAKSFLVSFMSSVLREAQNDFKA